VIDGVPVAASDKDLPPGVFRPFHPTGNMHHVRVVATGLDPARDHLLTLEPLLEPGEDCVSRASASPGRALVWRPPMNNPDRP
jgi:hypothetical protein